MKSRNPAGSFAPSELQRFILPITISSIIIMAGLIMEDFLHSPPLKVNLLIYCSIVTIGTSINHVVLVRTADFRQSYGWLNAILTGIGLGLLPYILPEHLHEISHILTPLGVI